MQENQVRIGNTDVLASPMGVGAWAWGDTLMWQYGQGYGELEIRSAFDASIAAGIDFFDTAEVYGGGRSERYLGEFVRESRRNLVIATKFFPIPTRISRGSIIAALSKSLERLKMDHVDLYQIHCPTPLLQGPWMEGLADAVQKGLTRAVGISNYSANQTRRAHAALAKRGVPLASNQIEYGLLHRKPEASGLVDVCRELNVSIIAYSPIAKGMLTGKYSPSNPPPGRRSRIYGLDYLRRIQPLIDALREIGHAHGDKTPAQVSLNWLMCKGAIPIPGAKNAKQAQDNAGALGWRLSDSEVAALDRLSDEVSRKS